MVTWFITGASSGLGNALARSTAEAGHEVVLGVRRSGTVDDIVAIDPGRVLEVQLDVTDAAQCRAAIEQSETRFGGIDVLVNNAGYGFRSAVEEADEADVDALMQTHFFGPFRLIATALPRMRERGRGTIVNVSSAGVRIRAAGSGFYSAAKAALEGLSGSLRQEVEPLGIRVIVVEPGAFRTDFSGRSLAQSAEANEAYSGTAGRRRKENDHSDGTQPGDPALAAAAIMTAVDSPAPPALLILGDDALAAFDRWAESERRDREAWEELSRSTWFETAR